MGVYVNFQTSQHTQTNMISRVCVFLVAVSSVCGNDLPSYMIGDYEFTTSKGFSDYMAALGVNLIKRTLACGLSYEQQIRENEAGISIDTITSFTSTHTTFKLGVPFQEYTADGRTTTTVARVEGNKLIKVQTPDPATGYKTTIETREFLRGGNTMNLIHTIQGNKNIRSFRVYQKNKRLYSQRKANICYAYNFKYLSKTMASYSRIQL